MTEQNEMAQDAKRPIDRLVMHRWGPNEGGYRLCKNCGTAEHKKPFDSYRYWFAGVGYESDPGCRHIGA